ALHRAGHQGGDRGGREGDVAGRALGCRGGEWPHVAAPARGEGGAGGTWLDAHVVVTAAGRHAVPLPLAETIVGSWLLPTAGLDVPPGPLTVAPVHREEAVRLRRESGGWRASGTATRVPWGRSADHVVVVDDVDGRAMVAIIAADNFRATPDTNL